MTVEDFHQNHILNMEDAMSEPLPGTGAATATLTGVSLYGLLSGSDYGVLFGAFAGAKFGSSGSADPAGASPFATSKLTYCQAGRRIVPLLTTIGQANRQLAALRLMK